MYRALRSLALAASGSLLASLAVAAPERTQARSSGDDAPRRVAPQTAAEAPPDGGEPRHPHGFVEMYVAAVVPTEGGPAVVLRDHGKEKLLPIWVGASEAQAIRLRLERRRFPRPLTHDLLDAIVHDLGGKIVRITVDDMRGEVLVGTVFVRHGGEVQRYDARASDSIALAVGNGAPIFVSAVILEKLSARRPELEAGPLDDGDDDDDEHRTPPPDHSPNGIQTL